ncbi:hypothetical protein [Oceanobacillus jeddahense]|nr:hypothetical protein [Oceanobacillus jeddahense]
MNQFIVYPTFLLFCTIEQENGRNTIDIAALLCNIGTDEIQNTV